MVVLPFTCTWR